MMPLQSFADRLLKVTHLNRINILPSFCVGCCIGLLVLPIHWVIAWFTAVLIHEAGHLLALKLLHVSIQRITLGLNGARIETGYISSQSEIISALAGPAAGLCCLLVSRIVPLLAMFGFFQSIYNLLPIPEFDGGRVLRAVLYRILPQHKADYINQLILIILSVSLVIAGVYFWYVYNLGPVVLMICIFPIIKSGLIKIPCKGSKHIVE